MVAPHTLGAEPLLPRLRGSSTRRVVRFETYSSSLVIVRFKRLNAILTAIQMPNAVWFRSFDRESASDIR